jgi:hypothetical protein
MFRFLENHHQGGHTEKNVGGFLTILKKPYIVFF